MRTVIVCSQRARSALHLAERVGVLPGRPPRAPRASSPLAPDAQREILLELP